MIHLVACFGDLDVDDFSYTSVPTMLLNHHNHRRSQLLLTPPFLFRQKIMAANIRWQILAEENIAGCFLTGIIKLPILGGSNNTNVNGIF